MKRDVVFVLVLVLVLGSTDARADQKSDCIAAADQGQTLRDDGKYRAARERFVTCSNNACPKPIVAGCSQWLKQLDDGMPTIVLGAKDPRGSDVLDVRVSFDGEALATSLDGKPIVVDPGPHKLRFEHEGSEPVEQSLVVRAGEKMRVVSVTLPDKKADAPPPNKTDDKPSSSIFTARNVLGTSLIVVGAGALVTGIVFGLQANSDASNAQTIRMRMPSTACRTAMTQDCTDLGNAVDAQNRDATISTIMWIVSGVFVTGGIVTFVAWPKAKEPDATTTTTTTWRIAPVVGPREAGALLRATF